MDTKFIIVGLGNPGQEYEKTRHNFGFFVIEALEELCEKNGKTQLLSGKKDPYILNKVTLPSSFGFSEEIFLLRPLTFMNRSGEAVRQVSSFYRIPPSDTLVLHDELDLPLGRMKLKKGGGNAGHNGLKSIQQCLGTPDFYRLRLGIGRPAQQEVYSYVLSKFAKANQSTLEATISGAIEGITLFLLHGETKAQQFCNSFAYP